MFSDALPHRAKIVGAGVTVHEALKAADALNKEGISARVVDIFCVKPIDRDALLECARATRGVCPLFFSYYSCVAVL